MDHLIGREKEVKRLDRALEESEAQLIIVYGRRRVGKTYLVNEYFEKKFAFQFTGSFNQSTAQQLKNYSLVFNRAAHQVLSEKYPVPKDWNEAFSFLRDLLEVMDPKQKQVVFFDEMPWMDRQRSGFLPAFEWFWNSWGSTRNNLVFIVCGSATSWMTEKLDHNKGGLFNRQTCRIYLEPFALRETELFLNARNIYWSRYDITQCHMIMGGIPYYLKLLDKSLTLNENIDAIFFEKRAELWDEFDHLYYTLFSNGAQYVKIVEGLSKKRSGLTRGEIVKETGLPNNGVLTKMLENLENSGFIRGNAGFERKKREMTYQLSDYYTSFYFRFVKENGGKDDHFWSNMTDNPAKSVWAGLAFEQVCKDHLAQIKKKLGISGIITEVSSWKKVGNESGDGTQIDLVIKRRDRVIDLCEIKFVSDEFEITKEYEQRLRNKVSVFLEATGTRDTLQTVMITTYGVKKNKYGNIVSKEVLMDDLFEEV